VFIVVDFIIDSVLKLFDTPSYIQMNTVIQNVSFGPLCFELMIRLNSQF